MFSQQLREEIGQYAGLHGVEATVQVYSSSAPRNQFLCPPAGSCPAPLLEGKVTLLSDLPKNLKEAPDPGLPGPLTCWSRGLARGGFYLCQSHHWDY